MRYGDTRPYTATPHSGRTNMPSTCRKKVLAPAARAALIAVLALFSLNAALAASYTVSELGTFPAAEPTGINASGQVVGNWTRPDGVRRGFISSLGVMTDLGALTGGETRAHAINDNGDVVGTSGFLTQGIGRAFLFTGVSMTDLGTRWSGLSTATGINNNGQMVGYYFDGAPGYAHPFLLAAVTGAATDMGLGGVGSFHPTAINAIGQVAGDTDNGLFFYTNGAAIQYPSGAGRTASAVNADGKIAGCISINPSGGSQAFLFNPVAGTEQFLSTNEPWGAQYTNYCALGLNSHGQAVGYAYYHFGLVFTYSTAWIYSDGVMRNLDSLVDSADGWQFQSANAINEAGQIAVTASNGRTVLLSPTEGPVVEYVNTQDFPGTPGGHFFYTNGAAEIAIVDSGIRGNFVRTGGTFKSGGTKAMCRFYGSVSPGPNSHFFSLSDQECDGLRAMQIVPKPADVQQWNYEGMVFSETPPTGSGGSATCAAETIAVYRAYNNAFTVTGSKNSWDSGHRYSTDHAAIQQLVTQFGWRDEGVVFCALP